jgi:hypothetical protein
METHSEPTNYELAETDIAAVVSEAFKDAPAEHDACIFRLKTEDAEQLNHQRIAQLAQDKLGKELSWRLLSSDEVLVETGADVEGDFVLVIKREVEKND